MKNKLMLLCCCLMLIQLAYAHDVASLPPDVYREIVVSKIRSLNEQVFMQKNRASQLSRTRLLLKKAKEKKQEPEVIKTLDFEYRLILRGECPMMTGLTATENHKLDWDCFENKVSRYLSEMQM